MFIITSVYATYKYYSTFGPINTRMNLHKHQHLTFFTNYLLKRGHFGDFLIQLIHLKY